MPKKNVGFLYKDFLLTCGFRSAIFISLRRDFKSINIKEESAMGANENLERYRGYLEVVQKLPFGLDEIFDKINVMARCIYHEMKQKLAYLIYEQLHYGPLGNWGAAQRAINCEFLGMPADVADVERPDLNSELFHMVVLKCILLAAYENLRAENPQMLELYSLSKSDGYLNDERAMQVLHSLKEEELALFAKKACEVKSVELDLLFYLGSEIHCTFEKHRQGLI
jgi:hypothetical protein